MKIEFASELKLPLDAATQTFAFIARKRAGKSYAAGKLIEGFAKHEVQFVILDPVGRHYGLRLAADGKLPGIDVPVLGGLRGDIPLDSTSGKIVANAVVDTGKSFVLDVSQFSLAERKRFSADFGEQLWQRQKALKDPRPIHVVLEEAQLILPQMIYKGDERMVGIWTEIVRLGGNCGIGVSLITQRPQSVSKEALTQVECLVVLQVNGVPEKKALKEWIVEKGLDTDLLNELPFLKRGVAYIWSPQWLEHFGKHEILPKWTFDASATPKVGVKRVQAELKPIDLQALQAQMAEVVQKGEANDPRALHRKIASLEAELKKKPTEKTEVKNVPISIKEELVLLEKCIKSIRDIGDQLAQKQQVVVGALGNALTKLRPPNNGTVNHAPFKTYAEVLKGTSDMRPVQVHREDVLEGTLVHTKGLPKGARSILLALAQTRLDRLTPKQIGTLSGLKSTTGTFSTYMSLLRSQGYIEGNGAVSITEAGLKFTDGRPERPTTHEEIANLWRERLPGGARRMFEALIEVYPSTLSNEEIAERADISHTTGTFSTYMSLLRSNGLIDGERNSVGASQTLFPE